ncbi:MAG: hypothetical protein Q6K80_00030 [Thermostichus sp. DG_1_6_bins_120]
MAGLALLGGVAVACRTTPVFFSREVVPLTQTEGVQPQKAIRQHISKDGTRFQASLGDTFALPAHFPAYLQLPGAIVISSGQIWDREGGISSLLLQTSLSGQEIGTYYRRHLWGRGWEILSDIEQPGGIRTLVFESPQRLPQMSQQVVIQVGSPRQGTDPTQQRDILILLSTVPTGDPGIRSEGSPVKGWSKSTPFPSP